MLELRLKRPEQPLTTAWSELPVSPRDSTILGISFRPRQAEALGLEGPAALQRLLAYPFEIIRLGAYWNRIEPERGAFNTRELDWQLDAAEHAGKRVILAVGALKTFGYPEFFVPPDYLVTRLREGSLIRPDGYPALLAGASAFISRIVTRYRDHQSIVAWQLEHEAVDPLGVEHSWRLAASWIERELEALRAADPSRPVMMNGFLPTSSLVQVTQWWRTRDQGDSLDIASRLADIVGIDYYPRHALRRLGRRTLYLETADLPWERARCVRLFASARARGTRVMVAEGQAEPWEGVTIPPNPKRRALFSCPPEQLIRNYNRAIEWSRLEPPLYAYLFWGAEYWIVRDQAGDPSYLTAFARLLEHA
jgi:glycosyl hydrolase family 42 (putative beta-galactosidase)